MTSNPGELQMTDTPRAYTSEEVRAKVFNFMLDQAKACAELEDLDEKTGLPMTVERRPRFCRTASDSTDHNTNALNTPFP
jgi:hypothetical protein